MLPFGREQFLDAFARYNAAIWPLQIAAAVLGVAVVVALWRWPVSGWRLVCAALALQWLWTGVVYHGLFFARINSAAFAFAGLFALQGLLFARWAWTGRREPATASGLAACFGWVLVAYAGLLYPLVGAIAGHRYPAVPMFGVTPCPVTLFTFGALLVGARTVPRHLLLIPGLWAVVGGSAAFLLGIPQDWPLLLGGVAATAVLWRGAAPVRGAISAP